jgi:hypothetical protein
MSMTVRPFQRILRLDLPYDRGLDVLALQRRLAELNLPVGTPDGIYAQQTAGAMRAWQAREGLPPTGACDEACWNRLFPDAPDAATTSLAQMVARLRDNHSRFPGGCHWRLDRDGIHIDGNAAHGSGGEPVTVGRIWRSYGEAIARSSARYGVPAELVVATIATESDGKPDAIRFEPGYVSDEATPAKVSPGLMQTLIATARATLANPAVDRQWLLVPENSIQVGTAYILHQSRATDFDPPVVACAYNAGSVILNEGPANRWRMQQYPINTGEHCDRFVEWFNDCMQLFAQLPEKPAVSFAKLFGEQGPAAAAA